MKKSPFASILVCLLVMSGMSSESRGNILPDSSFTVVNFPNNKPDKTGFGAVPYVFDIEINDVTSEEYCEFLNAVATVTDPHELYDPSMSSDPAAAALAYRTNDDGTRFYFPLVGRAQLPITFVSLYSAARYCNWIQNGKPSGKENSATTEQGSYDLTSSTMGYLTRTQGAHYFLPTEDEWYKAAFYNPAANNYYAFPNRSSWSPTSSSANKADSSNEANYNNYATESSMLRLTPVGSFSKSMSPFGALDMGGNAEQWTETSNDQDGRDYSIRGGSWKSRYNFFGAINDLESSARQSAAATTRSNTIGFRIVRLNGAVHPSVSLGLKPQSLFTPSEFENIGIITAAVVAGGALLYATRVGGVAFENWNPFTNGAVTRQSRSDANDDLVAVKANFLGNSQVESSSIATANQVTVVHVASAEAYSSLNNSELSSEGVDSPFIADQAFNSQGALQTGGENQNQYEINLEKKSPPSSTTTPSAIASSSDKGGRGGMRDWVDINVEHQVTTRELADSTNETF